MMPKEAAWIRDRLASYTPDQGPLLNIGSSDLRFRTVEQPYVDQLVFAPLRARGVEVVHLDLKEDAGVDIVGDLMDPDFRAELGRRPWGSFLCSNLLEHVERPREVCSAIAELSAPGSLALVTGPRRFPYHPDPIDTMFRPTAAELIEFFPGFETVASTEVVDGRFWDYWWASGAGEGHRNHLRALALGWRRSPRTWAALLRDLATPATAVCVALRRAVPEQAS